MKIKYILIILLLLFVIATAQADNEPPMAPPQGYSWVNCPEIKGAFLLPDGWNFKSGKQGDTFGFFLTKEKIEEDGDFTTGMTVNVIPDIPIKKSSSPFNFALQLRESARQSSKFSKEWEKDMGHFKSVGFVYSKKDATGSFTVHNLFIANNQTGTLYLVLFEAPASEWQQIWKIAEPMLQYLYIDDTI